MEHLLTSQLSTKQRRRHFSPFTIMESWNVFLVASALLLVLLVDLRSESGSSCRFAVSHTREQTARLNESNHANAVEPPYYYSLVHVSKGVLL